MYTQCSKCETIFKLSAEVLRAAGGQVRCGKCGGVFNALARLAEDKSGFAIGESALELETRADNILESIAVLPMAEVDDERTSHRVAPGEEIAQLEILDFSADADAAPEPAPAVVTSLSPRRASPSPPPLPEFAAAPDLLAETSMEFTLPPGELDRIFIESKKPSLPPHPESAESAAPRASETAPAANRRGNLAVSDSIRREMLSAIEPGPAEIELPPLPRRPSRAIWIAAAVVAGAVLIAQVVHRNREALVAHGPFAPLLRGLYSSIGAPVPSPPNLSAYQLRQWGVTGDPAADGTLRLRASILNTAAQLEPYPFLRVTLANRFGTKIGTRDFEPTEYLGKPTARLLAPGERADATLEILDPGKSAEGFEIDVCLRGSDKKIACANDAAPVKAKP